MSVCRGDLAGKETNFIFFPSFMVGWLFAFVVGFLLLLFGCVAVVYFSGLDFRFSLTSITASEDHY